MALLALAAAFEDDEVILPSFRRARQCPTSHPFEHYDEDGLLKVLQVECPQSRRVVGGVLSVGQAYMEWVPSSNDVVTHTATNAHMDIFYFPADAGVEPHLVDGTFNCGDYELHKRGECNIVVEDLTDVVRDVTGQEQSEWTLRFTLETTEKRAACGTTSRCVARITVPEENREDFWHEGRRLDHAPMTLAYEFVASEVEEDQTIESVALVILVATLFSTTFSFIWYNVLK